MSLVFTTAYAPIAVAPDDTFPPQQGSSWQSKEVGKHFEVADRLR